MDAASALIQALVDRKSELGLNVRSMQWPKSYGLKEFDIQVEATIEGVTHIGRGSAKTEDLALTIAAVELVERLTIQDLGLRTSNGVAAHFNESAAKDNALREMIERDRLLNHIHTGESFHEVSDELPGDMVETMRRMNHIGIRMEIWGLRGIGAYQIRACLAFGENARYPFGMMLGLGVAHGSADAAINAFRECLRHAVIANEHAETPLSEFEFRALKRWGPEEHHRLALNFDYSQAFRTTFCQAVPPVIPDMPFCGVSYRTLQPPTWGAGLVHIVQAHSDEAQDLYFGPARRGDINIRALSRFAKQSGLVPTSWLHPLS